MNAILEVRNEQPLYGSEGETPIGMQYDIAEFGEPEPTGYVHVLDYGESHASLRDPVTGEVSSVDFAIDLETLNKDPADIAACAAAVALHQTAEAEAKLLVMLGEEGFTGL